VRTYTVSTDLTKGKEEFTCICAKYNKDGILCSHVLKIVIEKEINMIPDKYFMERWRKNSMKVHVQREQEETLATSALLRFNVLFRKLAILNSKGSQNEQAMEYLMAKFNKMEINLDRILSTQQIGEGDNEQQGNEDGESIAAETIDTEIEIEDPERIQRKGRPPKPKRFKPFIEDITKKMVAAQKKKMTAVEKKKKKKAKDTNSTGNTKQTNT